MGLTNFPFGITSFGVTVLGGGDGRGLVAFRKVYFVDGDNGNDGNIGLSIDDAFVTIQKAVDTVSSRDAIIVLPHGASGDYDETVTTPQLDATSGNQANYCSLVGAANTKWSYDAPQIFPNTGNGIGVNLRAPGWRVSGFRFATPASGIECIKMDMAQGARTADTNFSPGSQVDNCSFLGAVAAGYGIRADGSPTTCRVLENQFIGFTDSCIRFPTSEGITAQLWLIADNIFLDSTHCIGGQSGSSGGFNNSLITRNVFSSGKTNTLAVGIDMGDGNGNVVTLNYLDGSYASGTTIYPNVGGTSGWAGNITENDGATNILEDTPWTQGDPG